MGDNGIPQGSLCYFTAKEIQPKLIDARKRLDETFHLAVHSFRVPCILHSAGGPGYNVADARVYKMQGSGYGDTA